MKIPLTKPPFRISPKLGLKKRQRKLVFQFRSTFERELFKAIGRNPGIFKKAIAEHSKRILFGE